MSRINTKNQEFEKVKTNLIGVATDPRVRGSCESTPESAGIQVPRLPRRRPHRVNRLHSRLLLMIRLEPERPPLRGSPCECRGPSGGDRVPNRVGDSGPPIGRRG